MKWFKIWQFKITMNDAESAQDYMFITFINVRSIKHVLLHLVSIGGGKCLIT